MNKLLCVSIFGASISLGGCGTTNYYVVLPEQTTNSAIAATNWDMDTQFPAMFKYLGCTSFGNGEHEPVCLEIRKLVQACIDYNETSGIENGVNPKLDKTCSNMVTVNWISILSSAEAWALQQSQL